MSDEHDIDMAMEFQMARRDHAIQEIVNKVVPQGGTETLECIECGDDIPDERRRAVPNTKRCVYCQQKNERR